MSLAALWPARHPAVDSAVPYSSVGINLLFLRCIVSVSLPPVKQVILPGPIDAQIFACIALACEPSFFQKLDRSGIGRDARGFEAMQPKACEGKWNDGAHRSRHVTLAYIGQADPIADTAGLRDAAADIGERQPAHQRSVRVAHDQKRVTLIASQILGVTLDPPPEGAAGQIVDRPGRLPRCEKLAAGFAQRRPFLEVRHLRRAQHHTVAFDALQRFGEIDGAKERHWHFQ